MNAGRQRPAAARATGGGLRVRAARRADADAVAVLVAEFAEYLRALGDPTDFRFDGASFVRDGFGRGALFHALVVLRARQLVGYLLWHDGYDSDRALRLVHVIDLFVTASERGHGIGRQLMEEVARRARRRGAAELQWAVYAPNRAAGDFYARLGGQRIDDLDYMRLPLAGTGKAANERG